MKEYINGWNGITVKKWKEMHECSYSEWPVWCTTEQPRSDGMGMEINVGETLQANGIHPKKIPTVLRDDKGTIGKIIKKIAAVMDVEYVITPEG